MNQIENDNIDFLLLKIANGDQKAFEELYIYFYDRLFQFARLFLNSQELSEEVLSDIFYNLWVNKTNICNITHIETYLYRAVKNCCYNMLKSRRFKNIQSFEDTKLDIYIENDSPDKLLQYKELNKALDNAINNLPEKCKIIYKMAKEDKMKQQTIAEILNISVNTVQNQLLIASKKIQQTIAPFVEDIECDKQRTIDLRISKS